MPFTCHGTGAGRGPEGGGPLWHVENAQAWVEPADEMVQGVLQQQRVSRVGQEMQIHSVGLLLLHGLSRHELSWSHRHRFNMRRNVGGGDFTFLGKEHCNKTKYECSYSQRMASCCSRIWKHTNATKTLHWRQSTNICLHLVAAGLQTILRPQVTMATRKLTFATPKHEEINSRSP